MEYADEIKRILEQGYTSQGYTPNEEVNEMEERYKQEIDSYQESLSEKDSAFSEIHELYDEAIDYIDSTKKLSRSKIKELLDEINKKAMEAY